MKHTKLLLIISILLIINACKNKNSTAKNVTKKSVTIDTLINQKSSKVSDTFLVDYIQDSISFTQEKPTQDSIKNKKEKSKKLLEVVINGKSYYKKHINDIKVIRGDSDTHYYSKEKGYYYDITTGKTVYIYGKHGKISKEIK